MLTCSQRILGGEGLSATQLAQAPSISLDWDCRQKSRFQANDELGRVLSVFLQRGQVLRGGDVLVTDQGDWVRVLAAPQHLLRVTPNPEHGLTFDLIRAAYHLGNRHVTIELAPDHLKLEPDAVLAEMLIAMGLQVLPVHEAFEPESGAYAQQHGTASAHHHRHDHGHNHGHNHGHDHEH